MYRKENNPGYMTREFKNYCNKQLALTLSIEIDDVKRIKKSIIEYTIIDDSDYPSIHETLVFVCEGRKYRAVLWHGEWADFEKLY